MEWALKKMEVLIGNLSTNGGFVRSENHWSKDLPWKLGIELMERWEMTKTNELRIHAAVGSSDICPWSGRKQHTIWLGCCDQHRGWLFEALVTTTHTCLLLVPLWKHFFPWELLITVPSGEPFLFWTFPLVDCVHDAAAKKITPSMDFRIFHVVPMKVQCSMVRFLWFLVLSFFSPRFAVAQADALMQILHHGRMHPWGEMCFCPWAGASTNLGLGNLKKNLGQQ